MRFRAGFLAASILLSACGGGTAIPARLGNQATNLAATSGLEYTIANDIPPRLQWGNNFGYCGETSMIAAGLYYGQYTSQYTARDLASNGTPQRLARSQLLLGVNDRRAARLMHLAYATWEQRGTTPEFLSWVKRNVVLGRPVIIGVFTNEYLFYGKTNPRAGQATYDHIVPVTAIASHHPLTDRAYFAADTLTFSDNGLWAPGGMPPYSFTYSFAGFQQTRVQANARNGTVYSEKNAPPNYGIAITGIDDPAGETLPVRVATSVNYERPVIRNGQDWRPKPMPLALTVTVSGLAPNIAYNLYRYDDFSRVPNRNFNANANHASARWKIRIGRGSTYALTQQIRSSWTVVYRAVPASGP